MVFDKNGTSVNSNPGFLIIGDTTTNNGAYTEFSREETHGYYYLDIPNMPSKNNIKVDSIVKQSNYSKSGQR